MKEIFGNLWDYHELGHWVVISTNGSVRRDGASVMGRGVAKEAKEKFPKLPYEMGWLIGLQGNQLWVFPGYKIITFPVKYNWREKANIDLIETSCHQLVLHRGDNREKVYMVRPGCGSGGLGWNEVKEILGKYLDGRFVVVEKRV